MEKSQIRPQPKLINNSSFFSFVRGKLVNSTNKTRNAFRGHSVLSRGFADSGGFPYPRLLLLCLPRLALGFPMRTIAFDKGQAVSAPHPAIAHFNKIHHGKNQKAKIKTKFILTVSWFFELYLNFFGNPAYSSFFEVRYFFFFSWMTSFSLTLPCFCSYSYSCFWILLSS